MRRVTKALTTDWSIKDVVLAATRDSGGRMGHDFLGLCHKHNEQHRRINIFYI